MNRPINEYDVKFSRERATDARCAAREGKATPEQVEQAERELRDMERQFAAQFAGRMQ